MIASAWNETELLATFARVCDGLADDAEIDRLEQRLTSDSRARELWLEYASVHGGVVQHLDGSTPLVDWPRVFDAREAEASSAPAVAPAAWRLSFARPWHGIALAAQAASHWARRYPVISCTVALITVSLTVAALALVNLPERRQRLADAEEPRFVAKLTSVHEAQWAEGQVGGAAGSHLQAGHVYRLQSGMAEVVFHSGANVVLEGPAVFRVDAANAGRLEAGKLVATVPPRARGFIIDTERGKVIDLGTRFAVAVSQERVAVHCFRGEVRFAALQRAAMRLTGGEAVVQATGAPQRIASNALLFVHDLRLHSELQRDVRGLVIDSRFAHNAALGKVATQSSDYGSYPPERAIDGNPTNFTHTATSDTEPWWMLDLGELHDIDAIVLHNRDDCCGQRLRDVTVEILADDGQKVVFASPMLNENNQLKSPPMLAFGLPELTGDVVRGRYVRVRRAAQSGGSNNSVVLTDMRVLSLGEVQVFATPVAESIDSKVPPAEPPGNQSPSAQ